MALKRESFIKVFELREELQLFFKDDNKESFSNFLKETKCLFSRYLSALKHIEHQQVPKENILTSTDKLLAYKNKIQIWKKTPSKLKY
jgi:hypothetical protein